MPNRLAAESSPYLLQHQHNPVDWYAWGDEAFALASARDAPVFLSIGYAACHWCHVMAHESFEDEATAAYLNENFVSVKVDREERPDIDHIYMSAVTALTGQGGWPMSVFLAPDGKPFHGGTYFPPEPRFGMPSFRQVLETVRDAWDERRDALVTNGQRLVEAIEASGVTRGDGAALDDAALREATRAIATGHDAQHGGWGAGPKFPQPMTLEFLLRRHVATSEQLLLSVAEQALTKMAQGGIYDQIGGGFHRYSVDAEWLAPHFEKMLYDNAQLTRVYLHAWQLTGKPLYRRVVTETLDFVQREMTNDAGGFTSTIDADSEGHEGKFYVWTRDEIQDVLGADAELFGDAYDVSAAGNWEGHNILRVVKDADVLAFGADAGVESVEARLGAGRKRLLDRRGERVRPGLDDKVITAWNGLMLAAFAEAGRVLQNQSYLDTAVVAAEFARRELWRDEDRLHRTWRNGAAKLNAYLEDYAGLAEGLLELYEATFDPRWFEQARALADAMLSHFGAPAGGFFDTSHDHDALITRPRDLQDNATPSGNGLAATVLARLYSLTGDARYAQAVEGALPLVGAVARQHPTAFAQWLTAADYVDGGAVELAVNGAPDDPAVQRLLDVAFQGYRPRQVVAVGPDALGERVPLLEHRPQVGDAPTAYVCRNFACQMPVTNPADLAAQLAAAGA